MSILSALRSAALIIDRNFVVHEDNGFAQRAPESTRTFGVTASQPPVLAFKDERHQDRLRNVMEGMIEGQRHADFILVPGRSGDFRIIVHVLGLRDHIVRHGPEGVEKDWGFFLWWRRLAAIRHTHFKGMQREFGLTQAEMLIVEALGRGKTLEEFAEEKGISPITARNQLRKASGKLGLTRQAEIAALYTELSLLWPMFSDKR
jgi:DNA-binding CsgD family transcriptional regulator